MQLGFLLKVGQFFGQAEAQKDPKAQGLLAHSAWYLSVTLTDTKPVAVPPVVTVHGEDDVSVLSDIRLQQQQHHKGGRRRSSVKSFYESAAIQGVVRGTRNGRRRSSGGSSCAMSTTLSETNMTTQATCSRATASTGAVATRAPLAADRARFSKTFSKKGNLNGVGHLGLLGARAARGVATEMGPGTGAILAAAPAAGKGASRRLGGDSSGVATEEGNARRVPTTARNVATDLKPRTNEGR